MLGCPVCWLQMLKDPETVLERAVRFLGQDPGLLKPAPPVRLLACCRMVLIGPEVDWVENVTEPLLLCPARHPGTVAS